MPDPVFFMRGLPRAPLEAVISEPTALADLKAIADLSEDKASALKKTLSKTSGFLDPASLFAVIRKIVGDDDTSHALRRAFENLRAIPSKRVLAVLQRLKKQNRRDFPLDDSAFERLGKNLPILKGLYPALARFEKAKRLATLTGQQLESIEIVCDLRPIFDQDRKAIEGMMPYTRLCVVATGADGLPKPFEVELTRQQVHDLSDKALKAKEKLVVLNQSVESWMPNGIPNLPLTRPPEEEEISDA